MDPIIQLSQLTSDVAVNGWCLILAPTGGGDGYNIEIGRYLSENDRTLESIQWLGTGTTLALAVADASARWAEICS